MLFNSSFTVNTWLFLLLVNLIYENFTDLIADFIGK